MTVAIDKQVPNFSITATSETTFELCQYRGRFIILYFYPRDNTPGCTAESQDFAAHHSEFNELNTSIFGISRDSLKSHEKFKTKLNLPFELLSDEDESLCQLFDVMKLKNMYGKQVRGIERSTFIIDDEGILRQAWRKVKVPGHVDTVLETMKSFVTA